jgi:regulatory protein
MGDDAWAEAALHGGRSVDRVARDGGLGDGVDAAELAESHAAQVEALLDWLQAERYLSEERFVESRIHVRAARYGNRRIQQELAQHGVSLPAESAQALKDSELERARDVWARKYGQVGQDAAERARQARFLAARGFSPEVIRRVVQGRAEP